MTKYMKVTDIGVVGRRTFEGREVYIDLYKINSIRENFSDLEYINYVYVSDEYFKPGESRRAEFNTDDQGYFTTSFSVPGNSDMIVRGPALEFIAHIEEQQKRVRKGKETESYNPDWDRVYTKNGKVHPINESLEPRVEGRSRRDVNIQTVKYIEQILKIDLHDGAVYPSNELNTPPTIGTFDSGKVLDLFSEAQDKLPVGNLRLLHKTVNSIVMKAMKHSQSANDSASISTGM
jgi:hypothetical protein